MTPRTAWQDPAKPITGPARRQPFRRGVIHYEGSGRTTTPADIAQHLRNLQASYLRSRGYSLGYGWACVSDVNHPDDGTLWEIRGKDLNMASNPGKKVSGNANDWTGSVLIIGPEDRRVSDKAASTIRALFSDWHQEAGTAPIPALPHSELDWTSCCGIYHVDVADGKFNPSPPPINEEITMHILTTPIRIADTREWPGVPLTGTHTMGLPPELANAKAITVTITAVAPTEDGYITLWADGAVPNTSSVNFNPANYATANTTLTRVAGGKFKLHVVGSTHVVLDVIATGA